MIRKFLIILLIPTLLLTGCFLFKDEAQTIVMEELGLDISDASIKFFLNTRKDSTGGITVIEAAFPDDAFVSQLENKEGFESLPFSKALTEILYNIDLLKDEKGQLRIPYADNGYYRVSLDMEEKVDASWTEKQAAQLLIAVYDGDTKKFHYCHLSVDNINLLSKLQGLLKPQ